MIRKLVSWHTVDELVWLLRYKTTVSSAREKDCAHRNGHGTF